MTSREELRETIAEKIYGILHFDGTGQKPVWLPRGNSLKQDEARGHADEIIGLIIPAQGQPGWQPIDSAPRDGTHILAYRELLGIRYTNLINPPAVVHWFDDPDEPGFYTSVNERAPEHPFNPTHWQPLPEPPRP